MGGKRKKSSGGPIKKESKYKIPSRFDCPLCDSKATIVVKIVRKTGDATVRCRVCGAGGEKRWNVLLLEKPVDVFFRFHEALIQKDQQELEKVEMRREAQQARLSGGAPLPGMREEAEEGIDGPRAAAAVDDQSWVAGSGAATAAAATVGGGGAAAAPARHVRSLGELQRKLSLNGGPSSAPASHAIASRAIDLGDDFEGEAEGAAAHYFAPRQEVHSGQDDGDDEYDQLFQ